jgi:hypothetical protein
MMEGMPPQIYEQLSITKLFQARFLGLRPRIDGRRLAYCGTHQIYYADHCHTNGNGEVRCPTCDDLWLRRRGFK